MLWDFTQDVTDDFHNINVTKDILKEVWESYTNLDSQFKVKAKLYLNKCTKTADFCNEHSAEIDQRGDDDLDGCEDSDNENDDYQSNNENTAPVINIVEAETRSGVEREQFADKLALVDAEIEKLIKDDLDWKKELKKRETQQNRLLEEADRILKVNDNEMDSSESINT